MKTHTILHPFARSLRLAGLAALFSLFVSMPSNAAVFIVNSTAEDDGYIENDADIDSVKSAGVSSLNRTKTTGTATRISYIKFDLGGYYPTATPATLTLTTENPDGNGNIELWALKSGWTPTGSETLGTDWSETALTWNNAPALGSTGSGDTSFAFRPADADPFPTFGVLSSQNDTAFPIAIGSLLPYLQADKTVTFMLTSDTADFVDFWSKDNGNTSFDPVLTFESGTVPEPSTLSFLLAGSLLLWSRTQKSNRKK